MPLKSIIYYIVLFITLFVVVGLTIELFIQEPEYLNNIMNEFAYAENLSAGCGYNIALGKPYKIPESNYKNTKDPADKTQLTDGIYTRGRFWTQKSTVGWFGYKPVPIVIDLGKICPISGVSFNTASGGVKRGSKCGPQWPDDILVLVSDDENTWYFVGELVRLSAKEDKPPVDKYAVHKYQTKGFVTFGRYVQFIVVPTFARYTVVDEVEVFQGKHEWIDSMQRGKPIRKVERFRSTFTFNNLIRKQLRNDLDCVLNDLADLGINMKVRKALLEKGNQLAKSIEHMPLVSPEGFRAILPMTGLEKEIFNFQAQVWRFQEKPLLRLWKNNRWDPLAASQEPESIAEPVLDLKMMNNEYRADVLNLTSAADKEKTFKLTIVGLPGGINPEYITLYEVLTTGTRRGGTISSAFKPLERVDLDYLFHVPAGMTRQIWFSGHPEEVNPGNYEGQIVINSEKQTQWKVPLKLSISSIRFPGQTKLLVSGWSYTDIKNSAKRHNAITPENRGILINRLQEYSVNAPWATAKVLPPGKYDDSGHLIERPNTTNFDEWIHLWPNAKMYLVYLRPFRSFRDIQPGSRLFKEKVSAWSRFWAQHMRDLALSPSQLGILIQDEPKRAEHFESITAWAKAIKDGAPEFVIWENPHPTQTAMGKNMMELVDVLCIHRRYWLRKNSWFSTFFLEQQCKGRDLWFYSPDRHPRGLDPYTYYLGQAWHCFQIGATGSAFWSFSDMRNTPVWNEYLSIETGPFSPLFVGKSEATPSKHMAAIREGSQDFEYLAMLQEKIGVLETKPFGNADLSRAKNVLKTACKRVLHNMHAANYYSWHVPRDRTIADNVRTEILDCLESLQHYLSKS